MSVADVAKLAVASALAGVVSSCASVSPPPALSSLPSREPSTDVTAYVGATVLPSPGAPAIEDGVVIVQGGVIEAVGKRADVPIPGGARLVEVHGGTLVAAFWNAHVHFTQDRWRGAGTAPAAQLEEGLRDMLTRWGFAHVFDTGSSLANTAALRRRIESGEIAGPSIRTTGTVFVAKGGQPVYVPLALPELETPEVARALVTAELDAGADATKLMTASVVAHPPPPVMPVPVVRAVTDVAHARHRLVFSHPTNLAGVNAARDGGVDILAHTAPSTGPWSEEEVRSLVAVHVSLIPTLSLWRREIGDAEEASRFEADALAQVRAFAAAGGTLIFGTDVGYRPEYDTGPEHALLARAGLSFDARLAMLTTAPAARFGASSSGRVAVGLDADLVILEGDPRADVAALSRVRCTIRRGRVLFATKGAACAR